MIFQEAATSIGKGAYCLASCVLPIRPQVGGSPVRGYVAQVGKIGVLAAVALVALFALQNLDVLMARWRPNATFFEIFDMKNNLSRVFIITGVLAGAQTLTLIAMAGDDLYRHLFTPQFPSSTSTVTM